MILVIQRGFWIWNPKIGFGFGSGGGKIIPKGFIKFKGDTVSFEPILDVTKIAFAGIALAAWAIYWIARCCTCEED